MKTSYALFIKSNYGSTNYGLLIFSVLDVTFFRPSCKQGRWVWKTLHQMVLSSKLSQELTSVAFTGRRPFRFAAGHRIAWWKFSCFFSKPPVKFRHSRESLESRHDLFFHVMSNLSPPITLFLNTIYSDLMTPSLDTQSINK